MSPEHEIQQVIQDLLAPFQENAAKIQVLQPFNKPTNSPFRKAVFQSKEFIIKVYRNKSFIDVNPDNFFLPIERAHNRLRTTSLKYCHFEKALSTTMKVIQKKQTFFLLTNSAKGSPLSKLFEEENFKDLEKGSKLFGKALNEFHQQHFSEELLGEKVIKTEIQRIIEFKNNVQLLPLPNSTINYQSACNLLVEKSLSTKSWVGYTHGDISLDNVFYSENHHLCTLVDLDCMYRESNLPRPLAVDSRSFTYSIHFECLKNGLNMSTARKLCEIFLKTYNFSVSTIEKDLYDFINCISKLNSIVLRRQDPDLRILIHITSKIHEILKRYES